MAGNPWSIGERANAPGWRGGARSRYLGSDGEGGNAASRDAIRCLPGAPPARRERGRGFQPRSGARVDSASERARLVAAHPPRDAVARLARSRLAYRVGASQLVGYPLILGWDKGWLPRPTGEAVAVLKDGRRLKCLLADRTQRTMYLGLFEPSETRLFQQLLGSGDTVVDVGAHIGWFSTLAARCVGSAGQVVAFEPYPPNATMLKENLARNRCANVQVVETALGSQPGTLALARSRGDSGGVTALDWAHDRPAVVPVTTLDEVTAGLAAVRLVKIDVEGWEPHVLRGAAKTLSRTRYVLIEVNRPALAKAGSSPKELFSLLRGSGFVRFMTVAEVGLRRLHRSLVCNVLATRADQD